LRAAGSSRLVLLRRTRLIKSGLHPQSRLRHAADGERFQFLSRRSGDRRSAIDDVLKLVKLKASVFRRVRDRDVELL
jgi:hypothetical protein